MKTVDIRKKDDDKDFKIVFSDYGFIVFNKEAKAFNICNDCDNSVGIWIKDIENLKKAMDKMLEIMNE